MQVLLILLEFDLVYRVHVFHFRIYEHILLYYHVHMQLYLYIFLNKCLHVYNKNLPLTQTSYLFIEN